MKFDDFETAKRLMDKLQFLDKAIGMKSLWAKLTIENKFNPHGRSDHFPFLIPDEIPPELLYDFLIERRAAIAAKLKELGMEIG